jgi:hypothetical protein
MAHHVRFVSLIIMLGWYRRFDNRAAAILVSLILLLAFSSRTYGQSEASAIDKVVDLRLEWLTQLSRRDVANWEIAIITTARYGGLNIDKKLGDPNTILKELRPVLVRDYDVIRNGLDELDTKARARRMEVQKEWAEVCRQRNAFRRYADQEQAEYQFDFNAGTPTPLKLEVFDAIVLIWAVAVFLIALLLRARERRLEIRKAYRAALAATLMVGLASLSGCNTYSDKSNTFADREQIELKSAIKDATAKADAATKAADEKWQGAVDGWATLVTAPRSNNVDAIVQKEEVGEGSLHDRLRTAAREARLAELIVKDTEDLRNKLIEERSKLVELVAGSKWRSVAFSSVRAGLATVLFGLAIAPFWSARRARRAAIRLASRTCPRCFRLNTLKVERASTSSASKSRYRGTKLKVEDETETDETGKEEKEVICTARNDRNCCKLRFPGSYLRIPRLCFPTVGVRSSGKTHMLVTAYDRIRKRNAPTAAVIQPAASGRDVEARFDRLIDEILYRHGTASATDLNLPDPILVHLKDRDPSGANGALINLFDYSGEMINPDLDVHQLRDTAVRMDGFMLFLDPTQLYGEGEHSDITLDFQLSALDHFLSHMRKERKVPVGGSIPVPVAVCISKFDLLLNENPIGGQAVPFIRYLLENLNPQPRETKLETIQSRSDLVEEMLPLMFTGVDVRGVVEGYFGKQVMFFPMSSVGLLEHELGVKDLSRRNIVPFGVAEPLVWLLHMHGYEVFG